MLEQARVRLRSAPMVAKLRHVAERAFAPYLRADLLSIRDDVQRIKIELADVRRTVDDLERHIGPLLRSISSANGTAQLLRHEMDALRELVARHHGAPTEVDEAG